jgi:Xaa-Pro aminopeptidase
MRRATAFLLVLSTSIARALPAQITAAEYAARRDSLAAHVDSGVVVAFGAPTPVTDFGPFFQAPAFRYLTGYEFADATMVMVVKNGRAASTLFANRSTPRRALYYGAEPDSAALARDLSLASRNTADLMPMLDSLASGGWRFYTLRDFPDADFAANDSITRGTLVMRGLVARHAGLEVRDAHPIVNRLRARKSPAELALLRRAAEISVEGHRAAMRAAEPGMHEYDLAAILEYTFRRGGAMRPAYGSIVGAGENGTQLHYMRDTRLIAAGDMIVMDAAAEYEGYAADITRSIPVSGHFTPAQRELYQVVRDAQAAAERNSKAGLSMQAASDSSVDIRARGLARLGLIESATASFDPPWPADCNANPRSCQQVMLFAIHGISHGLGLAVHDPVQASFDDHLFKEGDAFTIEPGIYVAEKLLDILPDTPKNRAFAQHVRAAVRRYEGTGIRIEDDYVIGPNGTEWITRAPREIDEIEALMRQHSSVVP